MIKRTPAKIKTILLHLFDQRSVQREEIAEFRELVVANSNIEVLQEHNRRQVRPNSKYYLGSGLADELLAAKAECELLVINQDLSPVQQRNLERYLQLTVVPFSELVLNIFAQRARSFEGKLQVELAQLARQSTRLVRGWTHLQRQRGGVGWRGGQGESQLELDRRQIRARIKQLRARLGKVRQQRELNRRGRSALPTVALVGYTNAGKSTLFNRLCRERALVADQLFATLDPLMRRFHLPGVGNVILADTVGFIRRLPHELIEAFLSTLQETAQADLLLHVIDSSDPEHNDKSRAVEQTLAQINADHIPVIKVFNKVDLLDSSPRALYSAGDSVYLSASAGSGIDTLKELITEKLEFAHTPLAVSDQLR